MNHTSQNIKTTKIGFFTPYLHSQRGNSTTARRIVTGLREDGFSVEVFAYEEYDWNQQAHERMDACDLFHILHFDRFSNWMETHALIIQKQYVVTSGGTDVNEKMGDSISRKLLLGATALTVFTEESALKIADTYPQLKNKVKVVPQSHWIPEKDGSIDIELPIGYPKVLLPSGVRKVKDVFFVLDEVKTLVMEYPDLQFVIVGEPLEQKEVNLVKDFEKQHKWFTYIGSIQLEAMPSVYKWADVVLNTSKSEGQPIALMEAMYYQKPVIARRNAGNESLVHDGNNGFLFRDPKQFRNQISTLMTDKNLYEQISKRGRDFIVKEFSVAKEIQQYKEIYQSIRGERQ